MNFMLKTGNRVLALMNTAFGYQRIIAPVGSKEVVHPINVL